MTTQPQSRTDDFRAAFSEYLAGVAALDGSKQIRQYRKALYFALLEALARGRFFDDDNPRSRFVSLVLKFGDWLNATRMSLPHLVAALERSTESSFVPVREKLYPRLRSWGDGGPVFLHKDPTTDEIDQLWVSSAAPRKFFGKLSLHRLRHVDLLYDYRNCLVHEAREPTFSFERHDDAPFYESVTSLPSQRHEWHLVFPQAFLHNLVSTCLEGLLAECGDTGRDPFEGYRFGHFLLRELNDPEAFPVLHPAPEAGPGLEWFGTQPSLRADRRATVLPLGDE